MCRSISVVAYRFGWAIILALVCAVSSLKQAAGQAPVPLIDPPPQEAPINSSSEIRDGQLEAAVTQTLAPAVALRESTRRVSPAAALLRHTSLELNAQVEQALREIWDAPSYSDVSLSDVLSDITRLFQIPIEIHLSSVDDAQLSGSTLISTPAKRQILYRWLANVLEPYDCTIALDYGTLKIVSKTYSYERQSMMTKTFDCQDILDHMTSAIENGTKTYSWRQATSEQMSDFDSFDRNQATRDLLRMILDHVGRETFEYETAAMDMLDGRLIVTHRYAELWQIEEFLDLLRRQIQ